MKRKGLVLIGVTVLLAATVVFVSINNGRVKRILRVAYYSRLLNLRVTLKEDGDQIALSSDGITIMGSLYRPRGPAFLPGIVLLHGSTRAGRKLWLYTLLAKKFAARGYAVLTIDFRGFGESEYPRHFNNMDSWDASRDVLRAVDYLRSQPYVDPSEIYVIGHSMGGSYAVSAGVSDRRIRKIVAIGPSIRVHSKILAKDAPYQQYFYKRFFRDRKLEHGALPLEVFLKIASSWELERYLDYFSGKDHQPIFLIDGGLEDQENLSYLKGVYERMSQPKRYVTIPHSDHYNNAVEVRGLILYDRGTVEQLVQVIDRWLKNPNKAIRKGRPTSSFITAPLWSMQEISLKSTQDYSNPFVEVNLLGIFTSENGKRIKVPGFYAGLSQWKIRFMPDEPGLWHYATYSNDADLDNRSGKIKVIESNLKGPIGVMPDGLHLQYSNGEPIFLFGRTDYYVLGLSTNQYRGFLDYMADSGFNVLQSFSHFSRPQSGGEEMRFSLWKPGSYDRFNLESWGKIDDFVRYAHTKGINIFLYILTEEDPMNPLAFSPQEELYFKYFIARLGAFSNILFSLGMEITEYRSNTWVGRAGNYLKAIDSYNHLRTVRFSHNDWQHSAKQPWANVAETEASLRNTEIHRYQASLVENLLKWKKPLIGSMNQETTPGFPKGGDGPPDRKRQQAWAMALAGLYPLYGSTGTSTHAKFNDQGHPRYDEIALAEIRILIDFFRTKTKFWTMVPNNNLVTRGMAYADRGQEYVIYLPKGGRVRVDLSEVRAKVIPVWLNPRKGAYFQQKAIEGGDFAEFDPPFRGDAVLHLRADKENGN